MLVESTYGTRSDVPAPHELRARSRVLVGAPYCAVIRSDPASDTRTAHRARPIRPRSAGRGSSEASPRFHPRDWASTSPRGSRSSRASSPLPQRISSGRPVCCRSSDHQFAVRRWHERPLLAYRERAMAMLSRLPTQTTKNQPRPFRTSGCWPETAAISASFERPDAPFNVSKARLHQLRRE
jgi:hypothetical protein